MYYFMVMHFISENGQKCEYQYCVKLREGNNKGLRCYIWASKKQIEHIFNSCAFGDKTIIEMGHIVGQKKGEITDKCYVDKKRFGGLVFECQNEETANKCAEYLKLPQPFIKHKENYTLNKD